MFRFMIKARVSSPRTLCLNALFSSHRVSSHRATEHDWSEIFSRPLTKDDKEIVQQQMKRTVSAVVPGKMFLRHWINTEQSTDSVVDRVVGGMIIVFTIVWASGYSMLGYNGHSSAHTAGWFFIASYLIIFAHMLWVGPVLLLGLTAQLMLD